MKVWYYEEVLYEIKGIAFTQGFYLSRTTICVRVIGGGNTVEWTRMCYNLGVSLHVPEL